jgi:hypothetical protein
LQQNLHNRIGCGSDLWPYRGIRVITAYVRTQLGILVYVGMLPSRGVIGILIWAVVGLGVIVFRLIERPKKTNSERLDLGSIRGLLKREFRKKADHRLRTNSPL